MPNTAPDPAGGESVLDVVAGVVRDRRQRILLSQRPAHKHQGGLWEFPGGKVEPGETLAQALARELHEELGIEVARCRPFMTVEHSYPDLRVRLHFREVMQWQGEVQGREAQPFDWVAPAALSELAFPLANRPVTRALQLPECWLVLPADCQRFPEVVSRLAARGVGGVYLRHLPAHQSVAMVEACHQHGLMALVGDDVDLALACGADGLHLSARRAAALAHRPEVPLLSVACHSKEELDHAARLGADMVMLSPVAPTPTHPHGKPLGWDRFSRLVHGRPFAVYALGGMRLEDMARARQYGARGLAGISAFWPGS